MVQGRKVKRILFTGTKMWSNNLAALVNKYAADRAVAVSLPPATALSFIAYSLKSLRADAVVRVGLRPGIPKVKTALFDCAFHAVSLLRRRAAWVFFWIGSDVLLEKADLEAGRLTRFFNLSKGHRHIAGAPWFVSELKEIGVDAEPCLFPLDFKGSQSSVELSGRRRVLTYIPDGRPSFYGGPHVIELARCFPNVEFDVVGGRGHWAPESVTNVHFHGWVPGLEPLLSQQPIVLRLVPHDAIGGTVREALAYGCHVIYTYRIKHVNYVPYGDFGALKEVFSRLIACDRAGRLPSNDAGAQFARKCWDPHRLTLRLVDTILRNEKT